MYWQILLIFQKCSAFLFVATICSLMLHATVPFEFQRRLEIKINLTRKTNKQTNREKEEEDQQN